MTMPFLYVIDDKQLGRTNLAEVVTRLRNSEEKSGAIGSIRARLNGQRRAELLLQTESLPEPSFLITDVLTDSGLRDIFQTFELNVPAVLLLDFDLLGRSQDVQNKTNLVQIIRAFRPSQTRIVCISSAHAGARELVPEEYLRFTEAGPALEVDTNSAMLSLCRGLGMWLELNAENLYDCFVRELLQKGHSGTRDGDLVIEWLVPFVAAEVISFPMSVKSKLAITIHELAALGPVSLDAAWILMLIVIRSCCADGNPIGRFSVDDLAAWYGSDVKKPCFIPCQHRQDRALTLKLFGEAFKRLVVCDPPGAQPCANCSDGVTVVMQKPALRRATLSGNAMEFAFCFSGDTLCSKLQYWTHVSAQGLLKCLPEGKLGGPANLTVERGHATSGLLCALQSALHLGKENCNAGANLLGSEVVLQVFECTGANERTKVVLHG